MVIILNNKISNKKTEVPTGIDLNEKDYLSVMFLYSLALDSVWGTIISGLEVDNQIFKNIDDIINSQCNHWAVLYKKGRLLNEKFS